VELCRGGFGDGDVKAEFSGELAEAGGIGGEELETEELATLWRILGRVEGAGGPFDKEGEQTVVIIFEIESLPVENLAVGTFAGAGSGTVGSDAGRFDLRGEGLNVARVGGPADEFWFADFLEPVEQGGCTGRLLGVGRDDFEIAAGAEGQESVASAAAGVNTAKGSLDASEMFDEGDADFEGLRAEEDVVEHGRHLIDEREVTRSL